MVGRLWDKWTNVGRLGMMGRGYDRPRVKWDDLGKKLYATQKESRHSTKAKVGQ